MAKKPPITDDAPWEDPDDGSHELTPSNGGHGLALNDAMVKALISGIAKSRSSTPLPGGKPLLRLQKHGEWVKGQGDDPVQEGASLICNTLSLMHGWSCWSAYEGAQKNELLGEVMALMTDDKPLKPEPINGFPFKEQRVVEMKILDGEDKGEEVMYKTSSLGGLRAMDELCKAVIEQLEKDPLRFCPVVQLGVDSYPNKKHGGITFVPVLNIVRWLPVSGPDGSDNASTESKAKPPLKAPVAAAAAARAGAAPRRQRPAVRT